MCADERDGGCEGEEGGRVVGGVSVDWVAGSGWGWSVRVEVQESERE